MANCYYKQFDVIRFTSAGVYTPVVSTTLNYYNDTVDPTTVVGTVSVDANGVVAAGYFSGTVGDVFKFKHASYSGLFRLKSTATSAEAFTEPTYRACTFVVANAYTTKESEEVAIMAQDMDNPDTPAVLLATGRSGDTLEIPFQTNVSKNYRIYPVANAAKGLPQAPIDVDNYEAITISPTGGDSTYIWNWEAGATSDVTSPGVGYIGVSAAAWASSTTMSISRVTSNGTNVIALLQQMTAGDSIRIQDCGDSSRWIRFTVLEDYTPHGVTHYSWGIVFHSGGTTEPDDNSPCFVTISLNSKGIVTDTLFDAKGDLAVGTAANTSAKLTIGANDTIPVADSAETTGIKWAVPATVRTALGLSISDSPRFDGINLGHASNTTIAQSTAGDIAVEGNLLYRANGLDVPVPDGGTGASDEATARTNLGVPRTLFYSTTDVTTSGTTEETFYTITIAAATLTTNGDRIKTNFTGLSENNANSKKWLVDVAGSTCLTTTQTVNLRTGWDIQVRIKRKSNTELNVIASLIAAGSGADATYVKKTALTGLNLTTTAYDIVLKVTTSASAGDVTSDGYEVEYFPFTG